MESPSHQVPVEMYSSSLPPMLTLHRSVVDIHVVQTPVQTLHVEQMMNEDADGEGDGDDTASDLDNPWQRAPLAQPSEEKDVLPR